MKPAPFEYSRPVDVEEACALLAADEGARLIAGGQTLVPLMAMRLARPSRLVDIGRMDSLSYIRDEGDAIAIGATTKQCLAEHDPLVRAKLPLLARVMPFVGHEATRARGTIGGSLANADPAAELVLVAATLGATLRYRHSGKTVDMAACDFFLGPMVTALPQSGLLVETRFPIWPEARIGVGFHEINARRSDFALVSAAAQIALDGDGRCKRLALGVGAAAAVPLRLESATRALEGTYCEDDTVRNAVSDAVGGVETMADLHASAEYRRRVAIALAMRAIADAYQAAAARHP
jgi:CO/xanthine dehydrogenase FAD-binding subunit